MSSLQHLAQKLDLSHVTVSAALRGLPWVKQSTRERVLRCAEAAGYPVLRAPAHTSRGKLVFLRVKVRAGRGRAEQERHRAVTRSARKTAFALGYAVEEVVLDVGGMGAVQERVESGGFAGGLLLSGAGPDLVREFCSSVPVCVYADIPSDDLSVDSVSPDYHQGMLLALTRLREAGVRRPGLMLDNGLPLPTRDRLISAYRSGLVGPYFVTPTVFFTPVESLDGFGQWYQRYGFDGLLATDPEHARRLTGDAPVPVFGINADCCEQRCGLNLRLSSVGRAAVELLHGRITGTTPLSSEARQMVPAKWEGVVSAASDRTSKSPCSISDGTHEPPLYPPIE